MTKQTNRKPGAIAAASAIATNAYSRITNCIVADLEQGARPWCKPWGGAHSPARAFARVLAGPTQLAIERGGVALQDHLRDVPDRGALVHKSATQRDLLRR